MTEGEIRQLHSRASSGENLTTAEFSALQTWYDENDANEDSLLNRPVNELDASSFNNQLISLLGQISQSAVQAELLARQNASLKQENELLRRAVEAQLLKKHCNWRFSNRISVAKEHRFSLPI